MKSIFVNQVGFLPRSQKKAVFNFQCDEFHVLDEKENVILVAEEDVANVGYKKIEKWLDEVYLEHFTKEAKNCFLYKIENANP